jgi:hypothetical protein
MDSKRKVSQVFSNNPQGSRLRRQPKTDIISAKLKTGKRGHNKLTGRGYILEFGAILEEENGRGVGGGVRIWLQSRCNVGYQMSVVY